MKIVILKPLLFALAVNALASTAGYSQTPDVLWMKTFERTGNDQCYAVQQTDDGGYVFTGWTDSSFGAGREDMYLKKIDSRGNLEWIKTYGGSQDDYCESVHQTADGGYILGGWTYSHSSGNYDMILVKTDSNGEKEWQRTFGGNAWDACYSVLQTKDGGYILGGDTRKAFKSPRNMYLVKTDANGILEWDRTYGGNGSDGCYSIQQTADGGYVLAGESDSFGSGPYDADMYLVKTDSRGNLKWQKTFGGKKSDGCYSVQQTFDGGYILGGDSESFSDDPFDVYVVKTDARGNLKWQRTFGGEGWDDCYSVRQTVDGGYILAGYSDSFGNGDFDGYLVKTDSQGNLNWEKTIGGSENDYAYSVCLNEAGDYILAGYSESLEMGDDDLWVACVKGDHTANQAVSTNMTSGIFNKRWPNGLHLSELLNH